MKLTHSYSLASSRNLWVVAIATTVIIRQIIQRCFLITLLIFLEIFTTPEDTIHSGRRTYFRVCRKLRINPLNIISRGLLSGAIIIKQRGLNVHNILAMCNGLLVNDGALIHHDVIIFNDSWFTCKSYSILMFFNCFCLTGPAYATVIPSVRLLIR